jgi:hypothetical protein
MMMPGARPPNMPVIVNNGIGASHTIIAATAPKSG